MASALFPSAAALVPAAKESCPTAVAVLLAP